MIAVALGALLAAQDNLLLLVADDLGTDYVACYQEGPPDRQPPTPALDRLAEFGVRFSHAYAYSSCSPSRAALITGRFGFRTGIGSALKNDEGSPLPFGEITLAEVLEEVGYHSVFFGKWHLGFHRQFPYDPVVQGWQFFAGTRSNIGNYHSFLMLRSSETWAVPAVRVNQYSSEALTDRTIAAVSALPEPWFVTVSYHAPHRPFHTPPPHLHGYGAVTDEQLQFEATVESLDHEIGRLLRAPTLDWDRTTVVFLGDNGTTASRVFFAPGDVEKSKGSLTEAGVRIPLLVAGSAVRGRGRVSAALVNVTDIFGLALDLAGIAAAPAGTGEDAVSFLDVLQNPGSPGRRSWVYSEVFLERDGQSRDEQLVRGPRYKLIQNNPLGVFEFHDFADHHQDSTTRTLVCAGDATDAGYRECRRELEPEARQELRRLRQVLETVRD